MNVLSLDDNNKNETHSINIIALNKYIFKLKNSYLYMLKI